MPYRLSCVAFYIMCLAMNKLVLYLSLCLSAIFWGCMGGSKPSGTNNVSIAAVEPNSKAAKDSIRNAQKVVRDSLFKIEKEKELAEFERWPYISPEEAAILKPIARKWLDFYEIEVSQMKHVYAQSWELYADMSSAPPDTLHPYYRAFESKDDHDDITIMGYSPNKQRYIDLYFPIALEDDGKYHFAGGDDFQTVYLVDRKAKRKYPIWSSAVSAGTRAAFWKNNDVFILAGWDGYYASERHTISVYDLKDTTHDIYHILVDEKTKHKSYVEEVYLKEKGVVID